MSEEFLFKNCTPSATFSKMSPFSNVKIGVCPPHPLNDAGGLGGIKRGSFRFQRFLGRTQMQLLPKQAIVKER